MNTRTNIRTRITILATVAFVTLNFAYNQEQQKRFSTFEQRLESAKQNVLRGLQSENTGLIESCIKMAAKIKLKAPSLDVGKLHETLDELSITHPSATVRYKAYIASTICDDPEWYAQDKNIVAADDEQFFIHAARRLQQKLFGLNAY